MHLPSYNHFHDCSRSWDSTLLQVDSSPCHIFRSSKHLKGSSKDGAYVYQLDSCPHDLTWEQGLDDIQRKKLNQACNCKDTGHVL